ncbi:MAG: hypothetical protein LBH13_02515 [Cellulomonadaceae bacterium]|jgi:hypothetical protein|nr:hypothetical protein [Cellulomonadaceae bacterium]
MSELRELIADEIAASEASVNDAAPDIEFQRPGREAARVYSVRLPQDVVNSVESAARLADVPASVVIRGFILDGLAARESTTMSSVVDRLEADLRSLRQLVPA